MMRRDDWLWLAIRLAGVYLIVRGVQRLPDLAQAWLKPRGLEDTTGLGAFLEAAIPLAIGAFLLLKRDRANAGDAVGAADEAEPVIGGMRREDWLWVGLKLFGAYWTAMWLASAPMLVTGVMASDRFDSFDLMQTIAIGLQIVLGAWFLFGSRLWRWACRPPRAVS